jgi:lipopolysaccharide/colanic/teichoic acid biosynthesis glycosyltransferase/GGDEF domain-containing protein
MGILTLKNKLDPASHTKNGGRSNGSAGSLPSDLLAEASFIRVLSLERRRAERSGRQFLLMLLDARGVPGSEKRDQVLLKVASAVSRSTRETDIRGWYEQDAIFGVIFTEVGPADTNLLLNAVQTKVGGALRSELNLRQVNDIHISFHLCPEEWDSENPRYPADPKLYPDLLKGDGWQRMSRAIKRSVDIAGSAVALILLSPLFILISVAVKLTSKGPILFKQKRVGQYGARFTFLKFRSMYFKSDSKIHEDYVKGFIAGNAGPLQAENSLSALYKLKHDPRVTRVGRLLRKTSLDELPQFINVLKGDMSLVGPRPPVPYEFEAYDRWHRSRLLEAKPGITGLWQVHGRSRTTFDDMVRLDLRYARTCCLWLDLKILLKTPRAVLSGEGAL